MKHLMALLVAGVLAFGGALSMEAQNYPAQNQYPNQTQYPNQNQYPNQGQYPQSNTQVNNGMSSVNAQGQTVVNSAMNNQLPVGVEIPIRTNENIDATQQEAGRTYSAEVASDVVNQNGQVLIPQGSPALLTVEKVGATTVGLGSNQVTLGLQSVTVNGQQYNIATQGVQESGNRGIGANKRTAEMTGGGALLGTVIGAIAGGGKGAAIGAAVGAAGGAATQVLTRGNQVKVPAETVLNFRLDQPLSLSNSGY